MGLDILLQTPDQEELDTDEYDSFRHQRLSRTFCNLMCRRGVVNGEPELDQIGRLVGVDISPLYEMENYPIATYLAYDLEYATSDEERARILQQAEANKTKLVGNLDSVLSVVTKLIGALALLESLPSLLNNHRYDTLNSEEYFADFTSDPGDGYIGNNFGQDLRNFQRFLVYAKKMGSTTVFFQYG